MIADYCSEVPAMHMDVACSEVLTVFRMNEDIPCIVLIDEEQRFTGLLMRDAFYRVLAGRYAAELFYARPALVFADHAPLIAELGSRPDELISRALQRDGGRFYDSVVIADAGRFAGILTVKNLMIMSGQLQAEAENERRRAVSESHSHVSDMGRSLQLAAEAAERSREECRRMEKWIGAGSGKLIDVQASYIKVDERMRAQQAQVEELLKDVADISALTREISGIAGKSGLLAMNASIEAAHAGEHGRGFQVVAGEVRSLALQTRQLSENITALLDHIGTLAGKAAELASAGVQELGGSAGDVQEAGTLFASLQTAVTTVEKAGETAYRLARQSADQAVEVKGKLQEMGGEAEE
ncbi:methyl-accepting chemotaxis protein [Paenibacillus sp. PK3_47]|uniref:methyl-accepting chemotaxis protein n=1 Tax=Paenibacillus sp. PK3_47 TaxID=2072642 RepID=UPI00201E45C6|nr:methyl-accepting chemotaxis protein [Paenibacillus sp. PK3_47]